MESQLPAQHLLPMRMTKVATKGAASAQKTSSAVKTSVSYLVIIASILSALTRGY
jgi:hypothetical protein